MDDRGRAFLILRALEHTGSSFEPEFDRNEIDERSARFIRTIVSGALRWRSLLDHIIETLAERPTSKIDEDALLVLRIGMYQIFYMNVPSHAAVSESVELAARHIPRARGFVNAILRKASRERLERFLPTGRDVRSRALRWSHPSWLFERWTRQYGIARAEAIARANQELSHPDLLVNTSRASIDAVEAKLIASGRSCRRSQLDPGMIKLEGSTRGLSDEVGEGVVYPMDEGSGVIARLVAKAGAAVLDLSAAPGGKSIAMALLGARVVSCDLSIERIQPLARTWRSFFSEEAPIVVSDGRRSPFGRRFDRVLVDVPCSGTGIIRRHPEVKWRLSEEGIRAHVDLQVALLHAALDLSEERCLYTTCSIEKEENDDVVLRALREREDFVLDDPSPTAHPGIASWIDRSVMRLTPESGADGFTAIMLKRSRNFTG